MPLIPSASNHNCQQTDVHRRKQNQGIHKYYLSDKNKCRWRNLFGFSHVGRTGSGNGDINIAMLLKRVLDGYSVR